MPACETRLLTVSLPIGSGNKWFLSAKELLKEPADLYCGMATMTEAHYGLGNKAHFEEQSRSIPPESWMDTTREQAAKPDALLTKSATSGH